MRKIQIGDFIKYTLNDPDNFKGTYGIVFNLNPKGNPSDGQVVWFDKKPNRKFGGIVSNYHISGFVYNKKKKDCRIMLKPPKKILNRVEKALEYAQEQNLGYIDNLSLIEILAKVRGLK